MSIFKNILKLIFILVLVSAILGLFFIITLPALNQDREQMVEQEMDIHNQTLEIIKQDFSYVLSVQNATVNVRENIDLTISGKHCDLKVELNRELKVLTLETIDKTENLVVGLTFACIGEAIALIFLIVWFCGVTKDLFEDISFVRDRRKAIKKAKKQKGNADIEVIV